MAASTPDASTGASTCSSGCSPATRDHRSRCAIALAEAGAAQPGRRAVGVEIALGAHVLLELRDQLLRAVAAAGQVLAHVDHARRPRLDAEQRIERRHAVDVCRRHRQALGDVVERARADPADVLLHGAAAPGAAGAGASGPRARRRAASGPAGRNRARRRPSRPPADRARARPPRARRRSGRHREGGCPSVSGDRRRLGDERAGLRSGVASLSTRIAQALNSAVPLLGSVTSIVSRFVSTWSGKWNVMNASPGRSDGSMCTGVSTEPRREETRTISPSSSSIALGVLGREVERLAAVQRRAVAVRLHARVVGLEPPAGGEADRVLGVERLEGRLVLDGARTAPGSPSQRLRPQALVQERRAGCSRHPGTATGCRPAPRASRSSCRGASARASAARPRPPRHSAGPSRSPCARRSALMIQPSSRASPGGSSALRTRCTRRSELVTVPSASHQEALDGQDDVGQLRGLGEQDVLHHQEVEAREQLARVLDVGLGLRRVLADHVQRAQLAALHGLEHLGQVPAVARHDRRRPMPARSARAPRRRARCPGSRAACSGSPPCRRRPARCSGRAAG